MGMLVVHHDMKNACAGDAMMLGVHQNLIPMHFLDCFESEYWSCFLHQILHNDNHVIWHAYNFFHQFFH